MENPFIKAAVLTLAVVVLAILFVGQLDSARQKNLRSSIDSVTLESETSRLISRYTQVMGVAGDSCANLNFTTQLQKDKTYSLAFRIQDYEKANIVGEDYNTLRTSYFVNLMDLYLASFENKEKCPSLNETPLVYFYREGECPDCKAQNDVLESLAPKCSNVRIYAFPVNSEFQFIELLKNRYGVNSTPAIVINDDEKIEGLRGEDQLIAALKRNGAECN
jgi:thiol-disulfide isomerase/thioredoxin